jgi:hypothetical protein
VTGHDNHRFRPRLAHKPVPIWGPNRCSRTEYMSHNDDAGSALLEVNQVVIGTGGGYQALASDPFFSGTRLLLSLQDEVCKYRALE